MTSAKVVETMTADGRKANAIYLTVPSGRTFHCAWLYDGDDEQEPKRIACALRTLAEAIDK